MKKIDPELLAMADKADERVVRWYLEALADGEEVDAVLEFAFTQVAPSYSYRMLVTYQAWRRMGVPARVLQEAGITR